MTFSTSLGAKDIITSVIVKVTLDNGTIGVGEVPTSHSLKTESVSSIRWVLNECLPALRNVPVTEYSTAIQQLRNRFHKFPMTISGLEVALFRANLAEEGTDEHRYWGSRVNSLETDITIPLLNDEERLRKWTELFASKGFRAYKLKVAGDVEADMRALSVVRESLEGFPDGCVIRLDGNQSYTRKNCLAMIDRIVQGGYHIDCIEQPLPKTDYEGMREIREYSPIPIILDETVFSVKDLQRVIDSNLAHGVNIKFAKSGVAESKALYDLAGRHGLKRMMGSMMETMTGLSAAIYFAAGLGGFDYIDLDAIHFLYYKETKTGIKVQNNRYLIDTKVPR